MKTKPLPLSNNLKNVCIKCFDEFLDKEHLPAGRSVFYDILTRFGYISLTKKEKISYYKQAQSLLIQQEKEGENNSKQIGFLSRDRVLTIIFKSKTMALEDFFTKLDAQEKHLKDILI